MILRAEINENTGLWEVQHEERVQKFKRLVGAFGYGDLLAAGDYSMNAISIVGREEDGRYSVIGETLGNLDQVAREAVDFKDCLLLESFYLDPTYENYRKRLRQEDGLTEYRKIGENPKRQRREHLTSTWEYYREEEPRASLLPVPEAILADFPAALAKLQSLIREDELRITSWCRRTMLLQREGERPGKLPLEHPLLKALVYAVAILVRQDSASKGIIKRVWRKLYQERI